MEFPDINRFEKLGSNDGTFKERQAVCQFLSERWFQVKHISIYKGIYNKDSKKYDVHIYYEIDDKDFKELFLNI